MPNFNDPSSSANSGISDRELRRTIATLGPLIQDTANQLRAIFQLPGAPAPAPAVTASGTLANSRRQPTRTPLAPLALSTRAPNGANRRPGAHLVTSRAYLLPRVNRIGGAEGMTAAPSLRPPLPVPRRPTGVVGLPPNPPSSLALESSSVVDDGRTAIVLGCPLDRIGGGEEVLPSSPTTNRDLPNGESETAAADLISLPPEIADSIQATSAAIKRISESGDDGMADEDSSKRRKC